MKNPLMALLLILVIVFFLYNCRKQKKAEDLPSGAPPEFWLCNDSIVALPLTINEEWLVQNIPFACPKRNQDWIKQSLNLLEPYNTGYKYFELGSILDGPVFYCRMSEEETKVWMVDFNAVDNAEKYQEVVYYNSEGFLTKECIIGEYTEVSIKQNSTYGKDTLIQVR